ncbi:MAG: PD-(D/E)XK nuclease family protein [Clostridia bacterium]|nr:PD-(D/E)XK nuclease family protein [Clostridia bacterium]
MLKLICSPSRENNTSFIYKKVSSGVVEKRNHLIIVPETHSHKAERRLLEQCGDPAGRYAQVMTFSKLANRVLDESGITVETVDKGGRVLMMYRAVKNVEASLDYYRAAASKTEILKALITVASEFRSCLIEPEELIANIGSMDKKLRDISLIYSAYCAECAGRGVHSSDLFELAAEHVEGYTGIKGAEVYIYGFEGFTTAEYRLLGAMIKAGCDITVALSLGDDVQLFSEQIKTKGRLERLAVDYGTMCAAEKPEQIVEKAEECLMHLADGMFSFDKAVYEKDSQAIKLYRCKDPAAECELVAGECRRLVAEEKVRLRDIAIVTSDPDKYEHYLEQSFARYSLPLYISRKDPFLEKPAAMAALGAFRAIEDRFSFTSVLRYMKTDLVGLERSEQEVLENYAYTWQIRGNSWFSDWVMPADGYDEKEDPEQLEKLNCIREKLMAPLDILRKELPPSGKGKVYSDAAKAHLERIALASQVENRAAVLASQGRRQEAAEYIQIYDIFIEALGQFEAVMGEDIITRQDFLHLLEMMLSQYTIGTIPVSLDSIEFGDFQRVAFDSIDHLFVIGAREGALPPAVTGKSLLRERDRILLETCGIELTQSDEERTFEYMSDVYQALDSAVKSVYFTYPERLSDGSEAAKSYLLGQIERAFPGSRAKIGADLIENNSLLSGAASFELLCLGKENDAASAAAEFYRGTGQEDYLKRLRDYSSGNRGPIVSRENIKGLFGDSVYMSATRAEVMGSCRFAYFMQYGIKAKERKEAIFGATNVGTLVHYVVEKAVKDLSFNSSLDTAEVVSGYVEEFLQKRLGGNEDKSARFMANYRFISENILDIVNDIMDEIRSSDFKPIAFEMDFGSREGGYSPYRVRTGDTTLELHGSIDRVDGYVKDDVLYVRVSDYKTGKKAFALSDILNGLNMQMFIYMLMLRGMRQEELSKLAEQSLGTGASQYKPCAALYIPVKSPFVSADAASTDAEIIDARRKEVKRIGLVTDEREIIDALEHPSGDGEYRFLPVKFTKKGFSASSKVASDRNIGLLLDKTDDNLRKISLNISKGDIEAQPYAMGGGRTYCDWCPFREACHFDTNMEKDRYRFFRSLKNDEVFRILEGEEDQKDGR